MIDASFSGKEVLHELQKLSRPYRGGIESERFFQHDPETGEMPDKIQLAENDLLPHGMTLWKSTHPTATKSLAV